MSDPNPDPMEELLGDLGTIPSPDEEVIEWIEAPQEPPLEEDTQPIGDGACSICGAPTFRPPGLTKTGRRKRAPKYCALHDPTTRPADEPTFSTTGLDAQIRRVQEELADEVRLFGMMAGPFLPVTGYYIMDSADPFTMAVVKMCLKNPRALKMLYRTAQVAPIYEVCKTLAGTARAVQVDTQHLDPHDSVGQWLGVARAYDAVYSNVAHMNGNTAVNNGFPPPPHYAPAA